MDWIVSVHNAKFSDSQGLLQNQDNDKYPQL